MCGRYTLRKSPIEAVAEAGNGLRIEEPRDSSPFEARYNIAPTQQCPVLVPSAQEADLLSLKHFRWGLIPNWAKTSKTTSPLINARSETAMEKPAFRAAYQRRRCLVPMDGFYEWKTQRKASLPFHFSLPDEPVFYLAGLWEVWQSGPERIESFTILTTRANRLMSKFHDRMPVILEGERRDDWLRGAAQLFDLHAQRSFFEPDDSLTLECRPANPAVNNNRNDGPECLEAPDNAELSQLDFGL